MPGTDARPAASRKKTPDKKHNEDAPTFQIAADQVHRLIGSHLEVSGPRLHGEATVQFVALWLATCQWNLRAELIAQLTDAIQAQARDVLGRPCSHIEARGHLADIFAVSERTLMRWAQILPQPKPGDPRSPRRDALLGEQLRQLRRRG